MMFSRRMTGFLYHKVRGVGAAVGLAAASLTMPGHAQSADDPRQLSGKELSEAWENRATTADEAITNLVRGYLVEQNIGTPKTAIRFIPYKDVPIEEECEAILKGKDYRLLADELPSAVTLQWGKMPEGGLKIGTTIRYESNHRSYRDNGLKYFSYPTLVAEPLPDGTYHAHVFIPTGPAFSQLAAIGKLFETGEKVRIDSSNSDYNAPAGAVWAVKLDDQVQRVVGDYFLPLESFVSHPQHSPRRNKTRFKIGYFKGLDVAFVVQNRVYDVFLIRNGQMQLSRSEPWTFIQNAKTYNNPRYQRRLAELCVTVFPNDKPKVNVARAAPAKSVSSNFARSLADEIVRPPRTRDTNIAAAAPTASDDETSTPKPMDYWLEQHPGWIDRLNGGFDTSLMKSEYSDVGN